MKAVNQAIQPSSVIRVVRGKKVMLDFELGMLYGVSTKAINKAVSRNRIRFPDDFMFVLTEQETENLRFQFGTSSWGGRRHRPHAFTEQGVAMLSSVLRSERAALVNIAIMRAFVKLRESLDSNRELAERLAAVELTVENHGNSLGEHAEAIRAGFAAIRRLMKPRSAPRRKIGFR